MYEVRNFSNNYNTFFLEYFSCHELNDKEITKISVTLLTHTKVGYSPGEMHPDTQELEKKEILKRYRKLLRGLNPKNGRKDKLRIRKAF
ncbi:MAG: hypothetical protein U9N54_08700, partial [candidate division Zixibacteria bacterium]|nr:hypothetical protein [candidate division Zixibacteria bacterium]